MCMLSTRQLSGCHLYLYCNLDCNGRKIHAGTNTYVLNKSPKHVYENISYKLFKMNKSFLHFSLSLYSFFWLISYWIIYIEAEDDVQPQQINVSNFISKNVSNSSFSEEKVVEVKNLEKSDASEYTNSGNVHSSFEEIPVASVNLEQIVYVESVSQNAGIAEFSKSGPGVIFGANDAAAKELEQKAISQEFLSEKNNRTIFEFGESADVILENATDMEEVGSEEGKEETDNCNKIAIEDKETVPISSDVEVTKDNLTLVSDVQEDIPSFSEWTQKQLEEAEKKKEQVNASADQHPNGKGGSAIKLRSKNYASPDCGAKIVAANPEAVSPGSVLSPSRDEYKLNACTSRIWFIVELCEAVQAKKIDVANFELFSSSPKDFLVSVSDRFPSREWSIVGQFTARDERDVQSFDLHPHLFGKYIKVEIKSHYGSEHFCPISLFRVYGTSEFEVLEKEDQVNPVNDDDDDETLDSEDGETSKNLFSSATDAVISIVKKAAEVLGNKADNSNQTSGDAHQKWNNETKSLLVGSCTTPSHLVVCNNCSDLVFGNVYQLLSCQSNQLRSLLALPLVRDSLLSSNVCAQFGLGLKRKQTRTISNHEIEFVESFFPIRYLGALCNTLAVIENMVVLNTSSQCETKSENLTESVTDEAFQEEIASDVKLEDEQRTVEIVLIEEGDENANTFQIKPTKTLSSSSEENLSIPITSGEMKEGNFIQPTEVLEVTLESNDSVSVENISEFENASENLEEDISELGGASQTTVPSGMGQVQKESVFLRLSNRIKALERNMSLSTQYLEELSRRYKKQVEEIQRLLDKTVTALTAESKRNDHLEKRIQELRQTVDSMIAETSASWTYVLYWLCLSAIAVFSLFAFCWRGARIDKKTGSDGEDVRPVTRRKSIDVVTHGKKPKKQRRPSEEALKVQGTYEHLLISEEMKPVSGKKRKKRKNLTRSNSITTLNEETECCGTGKNLTKATFQFESTPSINNKQTLDWVENNAIQSLQEPPFLLEESDTTILEPLSPYPGNSMPDIKSPDFLKTAVQIRLNRSSSHNGPTVNGKKVDHKKSASLDETGAARTNGGFVRGEDEVRASKKEKKGGFKRIFKKVF